MQVAVLHPISESLHNAVVLEGDQIQRGFIVTRNGPLRRTGRLLRCTLRSCSRAFIQAHALMLLGRGFRLSWVFTDYRSGSLRDKRLVDDDRRCGLGVNDRWGFLVLL